MRARIFVSLTIAGIAAVFGATIAANVLVDPQGVFGSKLVTFHSNPNMRYQALRTYSQSPAAYDAVMFGSSRANAFDLEMLAERFGVRGVVSFAVPFGLLSDHLPALEFLIRDQAQRGDPLKAVFLVLDPDFFGQQPWTNINIDSFLPPPIGGATPVRFWWRYLTVLQFRNWRSDVRDALRGPHDEPAQPRLDLSSPVTLRPDLARQLSMLERFVTLCREHGIRLVAVTSPLSRTVAERHSGAQLDRVVEEIGRITPVWDFGRPAWLSERPEYWLDRGHYRPIVARMIVDRAFGLETSAPDDFGHLVGPSLTP